MTDARQQAKDPNKILGVDRDATHEQIHAAYVRLARKYHPDMHPPGATYAEEMFKEVASAYQVLSDDSLRARYDQGPATTVRHAPSEIKHEPVDIDPEIIRMIQLQERGTRRRRGPYSYLSISVEEMTRISFKVLLLVLGLSLATLVAATHRYAAIVLFAALVSAFYVWIVYSVASRFSKNARLWFVIVAVLVLFALVALTLFLFRA
jgi:curved DNA-binding protein CbpA